MVLQRNKQISVWGWADANEKITVQFNKQTKTVKAGKDGKWMSKLDNETAGGPYQLTITGKNTITFNNVMVGEVWICSGQSNMELPIEGWGKINELSTGKNERKLSFNPANKNSASQLAQHQKMTYHRRLERFAIRKLPVILQQLDIFLQENYIMN